MHRLFAFIRKYYFPFLFLLLEGIAFYLILANHDSKREVALKSTNQLTGYIFDKFAVVTNYFYLREENEHLAAQNRQLLAMQNRMAGPDSVPVPDTSYTYYSAEVINNTVNKAHNFLTLDKGKVDGLHTDMAVISPKGAVGIISNVSKNYARVISLLNKNLGISGEIKKNGYFGSVRWEGLDARRISLHEIPNYVDVIQGDTIVTSGFSAIFPEGIPIGVVEETRAIKGKDFLDIHLRLVVDFRRIKHVFLIEASGQQERRRLETQTQAGQNGSQF